MKDSEFADCVGLRATRKLSASSRKVPFLVTSIELPELREAAQGLCDAVSSSPGLQRPKTEEFGFELSNLCITKEDLVEVFCNKFKAEILKAYDLANEHSALVRDVGYAKLDVNPPLEAADLTVSAGQGRVCAFSKRKAHEVRQHHQVPQESRGAFWSIHKKFSDR